MSERYQTCPQCFGRGLVDKRELESERIVEGSRAMSSDGTSEIFDVEQVWHVTRSDCGRCGGTGFDGDALAPRSS